ncbi:lactonase family protein [Cellulomonas sp. NS3]|uniref:lactonase family protein n=1 Tax=Cellulomonas sp. NS3 TaxID=2973977 RepID=UPI0021630201|nr:lactonase family protein [Cellulomonas sp. NS3]
MTDQPRTRPTTTPSTGSAPASAPSAGSRDLWVGTYPAAGAGTPAGLGEGVWRVTLDLATGGLVDARQVVATPAPSFVAAHPSGRVLYAVGERSEGTVTAFAVGGGGSDDGSGPRSVDDEAAGGHPSHGGTSDGGHTSGSAGPGWLDPVATVASGGADPCHLLLSPDARTLYVANYSSGTLAVLPLDADGAFAPEVLASGAPAQVLGHEGSGPDASRQESPHAHFVALAPGAAHVLVCDLGTDELRRYRVEADGRLAEDGVAATFPPGTGPRHLVFSADGRLAYVVGELDVTVHVLAWDAATATGEPVQVLPAGGTAAPVDEATGVAPRVLPSHVTLDGDRLLVGVRAAGVLAELAVGADGLLTHVRDLPLGAGGWPRHHAVVDGWAVVAEQVGGALTTFGPGAEAPSDVLPLPAPACVVPVR